MRLQVSYAADHENGHQIGVENVCRKTEYPGSDDGPAAAGYDQFLRVESNLQDPTLLNRVLRKGIMGLICF